MTHLPSLDVQLSKTNRRARQTQSRCLLVFVAVLSSCRAHSPPAGESTPRPSSPEHTPLAAGASALSQSRGPGTGIESDDPDVQTAAAGATAQAARTKSRCPVIDPPLSPSRATSCGPLDCHSFDRAEDAIAYIVRETSPLVLAVGEIHAQKGNSLLASPTQRFQKLLPLFCGVSRHIVIELWTGRNDCGDRRVEQVRKAQKPVTSAQSATNQDDFFELGNIAKAHRIQPHALTPSCEDFQAIVSAKDADIAKMLELTATRTADTAEDLLKGRTTSPGSPQIILYGGAMHNDVTPQAGREGFSFGPRLLSSTGNRYTELDIVLREQVRDTESFQRMAWYPHFRAERLAQKFTLYRTGEKSFALIFPEQNQLR